MAGDILMFLTGMCCSPVIRPHFKHTFLHEFLLLCLTGQTEIERACDLLFEKAETIDYRYDVQDHTVDGLLILPLYGSMPTGKQINL